MRMPRLAARSPSSRRSAAARSMPPSDSGATLLQIIKRSAPSSCMTSNLRSARSMARSRRPGGRPSKSRNGCRVTMSSPSAAHARRTSAGVPSKVIRSFSKISTASNLAAAMASSFSPNVPLSDTVAIEVFMACSVVGQRLLPALHPFVEEAQGREMRDLAGARAIAELHGRGTAAVDLGPGWQACAIGIAALGEVRPIGLQLGRERAIGRRPVARQHVERAEEVGILRAVERAELVGRVDLLVGPLGAERLRMVEEIEIGRLAVPGVQARTGPGAPGEGGVAEDVLAGLTRRDGVGGGVKRKSPAGGRAEPVLRPVFMRGARGRVGGGGPLS